ncbi:MAG: hypothetical protein AMJ69_01050 [Gammaproteobacteria bacterium SG8_47]|nr:MAG: hypothetical protein AMJ69_01050 [Gammaproteobacteria bacterium SG8_47]
MSPQEQAPELSMDPKALYREEVFTDRKMGTIRQMIPVSADGQPDPNRSVLFLGQAQLLTPVGAVPLAFEIEADTLAQAIAGFPAAAKQAVEQTMKELQELRREAASSIIVPEGAPGAGFPPGGGIQMP